MIPPYYCHVCDRYSPEQHDHGPHDVFVFLGLLSLVAMMLLAVLYVLGLIP